MGRVVGDLREEIEHLLAVHLSTIDIQAKFVFLIYPSCLLLAVQFSSTIDIQDKFEPVSTWLKFSEAGHDRSVAPMPLTLDWCTLLETIPNLQ